MSAGLSEDIAFDGFRLVRDRPWTAIKWLLVMVTGYGLAYIISILAFGEHWLAFWKALRWQPELLFGLVYTTLMAAAVGGIIIGLTHLIVKCAIYRAQIAHDNKRAATITFGQDETRQAVFYIIKFFLLMVLSVSLFLVVVAAAWVANMALELHIGRNFATFGIVLLAGLLQFLGVTWLKLRLSLASIDSFCKRRIDFIGSYLLTRKQFWSVFVVYLFTYVMIVICATAIQVTSVIGLNMNIIEQFRLFKQGLEIEHLMDLVPFLPFFAVTLAVTALTAFVRELLMASVQSRIFLTLRENAVNRC